MSQKRKRGGGLISLTDLEATRQRHGSVICGPFKTVSICSDAATIVWWCANAQLLRSFTNICSRICYGSAQNIHTIIEAERRAYADRARILRDVDFYPVPITAIDGQFAPRRALLISIPPRPGAREDIEARVPIQLRSRWKPYPRLVDNEGNAVAYTTTLNLLWQ